MLMKIKAYIRVLVVLVATAMIVGCSEEKAGPAAIPKDLNKELPKGVSGSGGGSKPAQPNVKAE
jgi:hypothetical protein